MNIEVSSATAASIWELLCSSSTPLDAKKICQETGLSMVRVSSMLGQFTLAGLVERQEVELPPEPAPTPVARGSRRGNVQPLSQPSGPVVVFSAQRSMDAMTYATAVEIGIPLFLLENTVSLSKRVKREAVKLAEMGHVDAVIEQAKEQRRQQIQSQLRGRAATRAAATDLAKLVQDVSRVTPVELPLEKEIQQTLLPDALVSPTSSITETPALTKVRMEVARQAAHALEALVLALEKSR